MTPVDVIIETKCSSSFIRFNRFTKKYMSNWRKVKPGTRLKMTNTELTINFKWVTKCRSTSARTG